MGKVGCRLALIVGLLSRAMSSLIADDAPAKPLEVEAVLKNWHERISEYQGVKGTFVRTVYDNVFEMQKLSKGAFTVNRSGEAVYCWDGYKPENPRLKTGKDGKPYILEADQDEAFYWVNSTIIQVNKSNSTFDRVEIPKETPDQSSSSWSFFPKEFWLSRPYFLGMPPEELKKRFQIEIVNQTKENVQLKIQPKETIDLAHFSEASLILDLKTYLPYALKTVDPPRTQETVHLFSNVEGINEPERIPEPDLTGYRPAFSDVTPKRRKPAKRDNPVIPDQSDTPMENDPLGI